MEKFGSVRWADTANDIVSQLKVEISKTADTGYKKFTTSEQEISELKKPVTKITCNCIWCIIYYFNYYFYSKRCYKLKKVGIT